MNREYKYSINLQFEAAPDPGQELKEASINDLPAEVKTQLIDKCIFISSLEFQENQKKSGEETTKVAIRSLIFVNELSKLLLEILKFVDTRTLLACRAVIPDLHAIVRPTFWRRPDAQIWFNSEKINEFTMRYGKLETQTPLGVPISLEDFELLESQGKFHLLKNFEFCLSDECLKSVAEHPDFTRTLLNLELEELTLDLSPESYNLDVADNSQATSFISNLFESQKDSLKKLEMEPLGEFTALQLPKFKNLTHLKLSVRRRALRGKNRLFFPPGVRALDIFPAVRDLDFHGDLSKIFPSLKFESTPIFPSVENLSNTSLNSSSVSVLNLLCPNLKHLRIRKDDSDDDSDPQRHFWSVGREIWRLMTQLESLEVDIFVDSSENDSAELDSCFTGISVEKVRHLYQMRKAESKKSGFWEWWNQNPEVTAKWRKCPSILDMKSLTKLTVNPYENECGVWRKWDNQDFYTDKLTWISHDLAFKLMPNLTLN